MQNACKYFRDCLSNIKQFYISNTFNAHTHQNPLPRKDRASQDLLI